MINSVNFGIKNNPNNFSAKKAENTSLCKNQSFGSNYQDDYESHPIRDLFMSLTGDAVGLVGFNTALWWIQNFVNGKLLVGKINKHFTEKIPEADKEKLVPLAEDMMREYKLDKHPENPFTYHINKNSSGEASYTHIGNQVVISPNQKTSLFHEVGHAVEENNTKVFKFLQRGRCNYTILSLGLYAILSQTRKNQQDNQHKSFLSKLLSPTVLVPMLAFSPELITEAKASKIGLDFLKTKLKNKEIDKSLFKNIKRSYLTCFATYLFVPVSIILMEKLQHSADQALQRRRQRRALRNGF